MPGKPEAEHATGNITDQVAKESKNSNASDHDLHNVDTGAKEGQKASIADHKANPGPAITENIGKPESREELRKRTEELNK